MAEELLVNGGLAQILPNYDELAKTAAQTLEKRGLLPGQTGYDEKFMTVLTSLAAPHMNINDPNFLQQALQMRSVGAALLLGKLHSKQLRSRFLQQVDLGFSNGVRATTIWKMHLRVVFGPFLSCSVLMLRQRRRSGEQTIQWVALPVALSVRQFRMLDGTLREQDFSVWRRCSQG